MITDNEMILLCRTRDLSIPSIHNRGPPSDQLEYSYALCQHPLLHNIFTTSTDSVEAEAIRSPAVALEAVPL